MAISSYLNSALDENINTFGDWFQRTNELSSDMGSKVLTAETTSAGGTTTGNTSLDGTLSSKILAVETELRGGTVQTPGSLTISSNTSFSGQSSVFNNNQLSINANTIIISSNTFTISSSLSVLDITSTGSAATKLSTGTTAQRPTPSSGMIRFNTSLSAFEGYNGTEWGEIGSSDTLDTITSRGSTTTNSITVGNATVSNLTSVGSAATKLSTGTTAQRPTPQTGMVRFNTSLSSFEGYDGVGWDDIGSSSVSISDDTSTNATRYLPFVDSTSGTTNSFNVASSKLFFNPSTGSLNASEFNSLSDAAYKENIQSIANAHELLNGIKTYSFDWKNGGQKSYGVLAQELETIMPELINNSDGKKYVNYLPLIAVLLEGYKTLSKRLDNIS